MEIKEFIQKIMEEKLKTIKMLEELSKRPAENSRTIVYINQIFGELPTHIFQEVMKETKPMKIIEEKQKTVERNNITSEKHLGEIKPEPTKQEKETPSSSNN